MVSFTIMLCSARDRHGSTSDHLAAERLTDCSQRPSLHGHANGDYYPKATAWPNASVVSSCTPHSLVGLLQNFPTDAVSHPQYLDFLGQKRSACPTQLSCDTFGMITTRQIVGIVGAPINPDDALLESIPLDRCCATVIPSKECD